MRLNIQSIWDQKEVRVPKNYQEKETKNSSQVFCSPKQSQDAVETSGSGAIVALFNAS